ncbi:MAG: hypothetical protein KGR26_12675, partial [Cyanobacteria bacterium REEB65]|nr:hypothetical protein [Cyanobacteria bacterium REEB65]
NDRKQSRGKPIAGNNPGLPTPKFTDDPAHLRHMAGRAAMYDKFQNVIYLNPNHFRYVSFLDRVLNAAGDDEQRREIAKRLLNESYMYQIGKYVIAACLYRKDQHWTEADWEEALDSGAMTVYLTPPDCVEEALDNLGKIGGKKK